MKLWILEPRRGLGKECPWGHGYDKAHGFVVREETEKDARLTAANYCGDEGEQAWLDEKYSTCEELTGEGPPEVIIRDFWAG
jgi:hypothetical protein